MSRTITLKQAHKILENSAAIIWRDYNLSFADVRKLDGNPDNEWMNLEIVDDEGHIFSETFIEQNNQTILVVGSSMFPLNAEGDDVQISILNPDESVFEKTE